MKHILLLITALTLLYPVQAQVTIGSSIEPAHGSLLDLKETDDGSSTKGLGLPRVNLSKKDQLFPMFGKSGNVIGGYDTQKSNIDNEHLGLVIYNLHTDLEEGLCPGVYVWEGTNWIRIPQPCTPARQLENSANSYMVLPGGSVEIPCGKPYLVAEKFADLHKPNLTDKVTLELLWQDSQGLIDRLELVDGDHGPYSKFRVTTKSTGAKGNALVAVRMGANGNASDPIVWSWHIWVTDYNPNNNANGATYAHNNGEKDYTFMDRNLGAVSISTSDANTIGLLYQWGRKDPFTGADRFGQIDLAGRVIYDITGTKLTESHELVAGETGTGIKYVLASKAGAGASNNLAYSIKSPTTFLYGKFEDSSKPMDWYGTNEDNPTTNDQLWGMSGAKSDFDPCPAGWRVPAYSATKSPWAKFEGVEDDWGWGGPAASPYVKQDASGNGANFIENLPQITKLGFYPYGNYRRPRVIKGTGPVGSSTEYYVGSFSDSNWVNWESRESMLWTANGSSNANAKAFRLLLESDFGDTVLGSKSDNFSKAIGAAVRCVKE